MSDASVSAVRGHDTPPGWHLSPVVLRACLVCVLAGPPIASAVIANMEAVFAMKGRLRTLGEQPVRQPQLRRVIEDSFRGLTRTRSLGMPSGSADPWRVFGDGVYGTDGNTAYWLAGNSTESLALVESGMADVTVQVTLARHGNNARLAFRFSNGENGFFLEEAEDRYQLFRVQDGTAQLLSYIRLRPTDGDRLRVTTSGSLVRIYVNGQPRIRLNASFNQFATLHGIGARSQKPRFGSFRVTAFP